MKKPAKAWKPVSVAVQVKRHKATVAAAKKAAAAPPVSAAVKASRSAAAKKAAATRAKKARKLTPDGDVALCSARAVAESIRLALGTRLSDEDVLALYWRTAADANAGQSILEALNAAERFTVAGLRPLTFRPATDGPLILGLELPEGPHAVLAAGGVWWSWGEPYAPAAFRGAVIEEAWAVTWQ